MLVLHSTACSAINCLFRVLSANDTLLLLCYVANTEFMWGGSSVAGLCGLRVILLPTGPDHKHCIEAQGSQ